MRCSGGHGHRAQREWGRWGEGAGVKKSGAREEIAAASTDERGGWSLACEKHGAEVLELFQGASVHGWREWPGPQTGLGRYRLLSPLTTVNKQGSGASEAFGFLLGLRVHGVRRGLPCSRSAEATDEDNDVLRERVEVSSPS